MEIKFKEIFDNSILVFLIAAMLKEFTSGNTSIDIFMLGVLFRVYVEVFFKKEKS